MPQSEALVGLCPACLLRCASSQRASGFQIVARLGVGPTSSTYLAESPSDSSRLLVLKRMIAAPGVGDVATRVAAMRGPLLALDHPHIGRQLELSVDDEGQPYSITEFWPGVPLTRFAVAGWRKRAAQGTRLIGELLAQVETALRYAHRCGTVHGSLVSANVLVARTGAGPAVKVLDFGHAALVGRLPRAPVQADDLRALDDFLRACRRH